MLGSKQMKQEGKFLQALSETCSQNMAENYLYSK